DDVAQIALQQGGPQLLAEVGQMLFEPRQEETMIGWIQQFSDLLTTAEARRVLKDLRELAAADFPLPYIAESRPTISALQCMVDVIFPANTWHLQRARWIAQRELLTEAELEERAAGREGWDKDFVQEVLKHPGRTFNTSSFAMALADRQRQTGGLWTQSWDESDELFEVWHFYTRATYRGIPTIMRTILHPDAGELYAVHEPLPYAHGEYPFIEFVRERRARSILQSRGWPELIETDQDQIKTQRDFRTDRASMTTLPTMRQSPRLGGVQLAFGPGVVIPAKQGEIEPLNLANGDNTSVEVEAATKAGVNEYVGRLGVGIEPALVARKEEHAISTWLKPWTRAATQMLKLAQQYTEPMMIGQVTGMIPKPQEITPENIAGGFRLMLTFDPRFMTSDWVFGILERIEKYMLPMDRNAVLNPDAILRWAMSGIDPTLGDLAVRDSQQAAQSEIEDEMKNLALMVTGQNPPMIPRGQNYAARLQVLQQAFQQNPGFYQQLLQARPDFQQLVQQRMEFLQQQIQQDQNRVIGVYGTTPSPTSPGMGGSAPAPQIGAFTGGAQ
ncbi:MAG: hypothetical protein EBR82_43915, partial [Caulobacteraceae bacterium]|nr:hypothetical protein [Caulobacteraceae bacterium]